MSGTTPSVVEIFKDSYGKMNYVVPEDLPIANLLEFSEAEKVGDNFVETAVLSNETGITISSSNESFNINPPRAGSVKQTSVASRYSVLASSIPWSFASRAAAKGKTAFVSSTKHLVESNLRSHEKFHEIWRLYGQSPDLLGRVSYFSGTYRNAAFTSGSGTLTDGAGNTYTFTNGVDTTNKYILMKPGQFAAGIFVGMEGCKIDQVDSTGAVVATGNLVKTFASLGFIEVDFTPVAASSATSHRICMEGMADANEYVGMHYIISRSGTLFGINNQVYSLWAGNTINLNQTKLTLQKFNTIVADGVNAGGIDGDLYCFLNPRSWVSIVNPEMGLKQYSSGEKKIKQGFRSIEMDSLNGMTTFVAHRYVKEGDSFICHLPSWVRSGSSPVSFNVPGFPEKIIFPMENNAGYAYRSVADEYIYCRRPSWQIYVSGIDDEASS